MTLPARLGLYYAAIFIGLGASSPYAPVWFAAQGLTGAQIGLILSLPMLARAITAPVLALWADGFRLRRTPLAMMAAGTALAYGLLAAPFGFTWQLVLWFAASSMFSTLAPLADVIVLANARRHGFNFGWPRGMGSAAFIVANIGVGMLLTYGSADVVLVWITAAVALASLAARFALPADAVHDDATGPEALADRLTGLGGLLRDPAFMTVVLAAGLIQSAHAFYYGFSALAWKAQGIPEDITGVLWAVGVAVEIGFLWFMDPWRRQVGPRLLLVLGGAASVVRWAVLAASPPLWVLFPLQALHAFTYAATFLASLQLVEMVSTRRNASAAQAINSALSSGVLAGLATLVSGGLYDRAGAHGYLLMAAMSATGLIVAIGLYRVRRLDS